MRPTTLAALLLGLAALAGCGSNAQTTDPKSLPPLTERDKEEIRRRDAEVRAEEEGLRYEAPGARKPPARIAVKR